MKCTFSPSKQPERLVRDAATQLAHSQVKKEVERVRNLFHVVCAEHGCLNFHLTAMTLYLCWKYENKCCINLSGRFFHLINVRWLKYPHRGYPQCCCLFCPCVFMLNISMFIYVMWFCCPFLFRPVLQFESTRSSSPTECCRFSPWSRKVVVLPPSLPPSWLLRAPSNTLFSTPYLFLFVWLLLIYIMSLFKCMPT